MQKRQEHTKRKYEFYSIEDLYCYSDDTLASSGWDDWVVNT